MCCLIQFQIDSVSPQKVRFKSDLFGSFGVGLFTPPNTIHFEEIFDNIGQKLLDNLPVVATIVFTALLYLPLAIICRRFDKRDKVKVKPIRNFFNVYGPIGRTKPCILILGGFSMGDRFEFGSVYHCSRD